MNRDPVLFRVDGTSQSGWEGLGRCLVLAAALQRRRRQSYFLGQLEPTSLAFQVKRGGNEWLDADSSVGTSDDLTETIQEIRRLGPAAVIVDSPNAGEDYLAALRTTGVLVVVLDHQAHLRFPAQLVINPLLAPSREAYSFRPGTQLLLGPRYALVRPEIRRVRAVRSQEPAQPIRALLALGDDDPHHQVVPLTRTLLGLAKLERIDVIVRPWHPEVEVLRELAAAHPERLEVATEGAEVTARIGRCHFAVTSGGGMSLELACVGVPQLVVVQSEAHWPTAQRLEEEGVATCLGWYETVSAQTVRQAIVNVLGDALERQAMARCGRQLIDGRGPDRLVTALEVMLHPSRLVDFSQAA